MNPDRDYLHGSNRPPERAECTICTRLVMVAVAAAILAAILALSSYGFAP